uniref:tetratricopeptide repeat protein n=1 Tax=Chamaesiphon sp. VAR_48_metabat_403 TaxID=2964700 RepID=UPI00286EB21D
QWQLNPGYVFDREQGKFQTQNRQSFGNGYNIIYSSISYGGMSGGGVFDTAGRVIGIHGRAEQTQDVMLGNSQGISIQTLIALAPRLQLNPKLLKTAKTPVPALTPLALKTIEMAMVNLAQPTPEDTGERWLTYGNQLYRTKQFEKSVTAFDKAIAKGQSLTGSYGKALSLYDSGRLDLASAAIAKAIAAVPVKERANYYYLWKWQSVIFRFREQYASALESIDTAIKLEPQDRTLVEEKALILSNRKQYAEAMKIYDNMIREREEAGAYLGRGNVKSALGDKGGAIVDYERAIKINPNYAMAYMNRGIAKHELFDIKGAIADYDRAIKINPNYADVYYSRGAAKLALGDNQGGFADLDRTIKINPDSAFFHYMRGTAKLSLGDNQGAMADFDRTIKIEPDLAEAYNNRGVAKFNLGDNKGAIADYERAIKIKPQYAQAYENRGVAKSGLGNNQGAIIDLSKAAELFRQQGQMNLYQKTMGLIAALKAS